MLMETKKMQKKSRLEIIKRMKRVIGTRDHKELASDLGIDKQLITNYIVRGDSAFYHRIFEFGKKHNLSYDWLFHEKVPDKVSLQYEHPEDEKYINMLKALLNAKDARIRDFIKRDVEIFHERLIMEQGAVPRRKKSRK
jgi:hypothetical protein